MKNSICILLIILMLLFVSCASPAAPTANSDVTEPAAINTEAAEPTPDETEVPLPTPDETEVPLPTPFMLENDNSPIIYPEKKALSAEDQELADRCYALLEEEYPEFYKIPRELMLERVDRDGKYYSVEFIFCLGGCSTFATYKFATAHPYPEGKWFTYGDIYGYEFTPDSVLTEAEVAMIKTLIADSISAYIDENKLKTTEVSTEKMHLMWTVFEGKLCAMSEEIAYVTDETTEKYGCGDHAHVLGLVFVDFTPDGAQLTDRGAIGD